MRRRVRRQWLTTVFAGSALAALPFAAANAADMPVKAPPRALVVESGGAYFWLDGSYQSIRLPTYNLGFGGRGAGNSNLGLLESHNPRPEGWGIAGAIGYRLPHGTLPGSNARIELGASYIKADDSQAGANSSIPAAGAYFLQNLSGRVIVSETCAIVGVAERHRG